jgi:hypothetical protein
VRYLVYLLIIANLVYFTWYQFSPKQGPEAIQPIPVPPGIDPLVLLSERVTQPEQMSVEKLQVDDVGQAEATAMETEEVIPVEEDYIAVVSEAVQETEPESLFTEPEPKPERICQTVGPLLDKNDTDALLSELSKNGYPVNVRDGEVREPAGYWVYLPATSAREARRIVADLDANGMKDYFIGKKNHISLGIFSKKEKARVRLKQVKELGYDAILDQRYRTRVVYWLDFEQQGRPLLGSVIWEKIQAQHTDIRVQRVSCE